MPLICTFKMVIMVNFMLCIFYHIKKDTSLEATMPTPDSNIHIQTMILLTYATLNPRDTEPLNCPSWVTWKIPCEERHAPHRKLSDAPRRWFQKATECLPGFHSCKQLVGKEWLKLCIGKNCVTIQIRGFN